MVPSIEDVIFHSFAAVSVISAIAVVLIRSPIYSALFLAITMSALGVLFFSLDAAFIAVAQVTVYAGAVMVLFVMVLMLFDLKHDKEQVFKLTPINLAKFVVSGLLCGFLIATGWLAVTVVQSPATQLAPNTTAFGLNAFNVASKDALAKHLPKREAPPTELTETMTANAKMVAEEKSVQLPADEEISGAAAAELVVKDLTKQKIPDRPAYTPSSTGNTAVLSARLFTKFIFAFEAISLLLLIAIVGAVALAKSKGGTHHAAK